MTQLANPEFCCEPQSRQAPRAPGLLTWLAAHFSGLRMRKRHAKLPIQDARAMQDIGLGTHGNDGSFARIPKENLRREMIALKLMGR